MIYSENGLVKITAPKNKLKKSRDYNVPNAR